LYNHSRDKTFLERIVPIDIESHNVPGPESSKGGGRLARGHKDSATVYVEKHAEAGIEVDHARDGDQLFIEKIPEQRTHRKNPFSEP
jgi:hypothetical protein